MGWWALIGVLVTVSAIGLTFAGCAEGLVIGVFAGIPLMVYGFFGERIRWRRRRRGVSTRSPKIS